MIEITEEYLKEFKDFLDQPGLQFESIPSSDNSWFLLKAHNVGQEFKLAKDIYNKLYPKYDTIIFGKDSTENIVSIECVEDKVILFKEVDGLIEKEERDFSPFILTNKPMTKTSQLLEGKQFYKWKISCKDISEFKDIKNKFYKKRTDFYTANNLKENYMLQSGVTYFKGMQPKDISVLSFDIETSGLSFDDNSEVYLITNTYRNKEQVIRKTFDIFDYNCRQQDMLEAWCDWVQEINPSIMLGHNIISYDLKFMDHVSKNGLKLGRDNSNLEFETRESEKRKDGSQSYKYFKAHIFGRELVDTFFLSLTYDIGRKYESYSLKQIIRQEGLEKQGRTFVDAGKIRNVFYKIISSNYKDQSALDEWKLIRAYAEDDSDDALKLFDLMIPALFYTNQAIPKSLQAMTETATGSQLNSLLIRGYLQDNKSIPKADKTDYVEGGISFAIPGIYRNLIKVDLKSCYPSQILRFKLYDKYKDPEGLFYYMVKYFTEKRFEYKKLGKQTGNVYYKDLDASAKVFINSAYGLCQTGGLQFNAPHIASKITLESRKLIDMALVWGSGKGVDYWKQLFLEKTGKETDDETT